MDLKIVAAAESELAEAHAWYVKQSAHATDDFYSAIENALGRITTHPQLYAPDEFGVRACRVHRYPYAVLFVAREESVTVVAIAHDSRRPGYWRDR